VKEIERESEREIKTKMCRMGGIGFLKRVVKEQPHLYMSGILYNGT